MAGKDYSTIGSSSSKRESYSTSHAFSSGNSGAKKTSTSTSFGGGDDNRETYRTKTQYTQYTPTQTKKAKAKVAADKKADDLKRLNELQYEKPTGLARFSPLVVGMHVTGIGKKTFEVNKSYFQKNVADQFINGKKSTYTNSPESFKQYMQDRGMGRVDAYGRTISNNDNGGGSYVVEKNIGGKTLLTTTPTTAEVSQSKAAQVEDSIELKKRRVKAKGRSPTIMTGVTGATGGLTLGKPSLLGM